MRADAAASDVQNVEILITAAEAFPAFERAVLSAQREVTAGFRIFDFSTRLRTSEARAIGEDWFDLILHVVGRGVSFRMILSDFDPTVGTELHGLTWRSVRQAVALKELAGSEAQIDVRASLHPASVGLLARIALWPRVQGLLRQKIVKAASGGDAGIARFLSRHPRLSDFFARTGGRLRPKLWPLPSLWPVTHHQKVAVIDDNVLYVGGLDLNERRWDTPDHARESAATWHDVQLVVQDRVAARDVRRHLEELLPVVFGEAEVSVMHGSVLRTVSAKVVGRPSFLAPRPIRREIEFALLEAIAKANRLIYIETQFLRDRRISKALARAARRNANLTLILILPAAPEDVAYGHTTRSDARFGEYLQAAAIRRLRRAFSGRLFIGSPVQPVAAKGHGRAILHGSPIVYVHAKVAIFDNQLAIVGSANLNGRSLRWDTEVAVALRDPETVRALRNRCMEHMLGLSATDRQELFNVDTAVSGWQNVALANAKAAPHDRDGLVVPYLSRPGRRFGRALPAVPEEMV